MNTINNRIALMIFMAVIVLLGWLTPSLAKSVIAPDLVHPSRDRTTDYQLAQTAPRLAQSTTQKGSQPSNIPTSLYSVHTAGIPTARNVDHVGLTVPDLNQALTFFVDVLGADVLWVEPEGYGTQRPLNMEGIFNVDPHSSVTISLLRFGPNINLELMEYKAPDQNRQIPKNSDIDVPHIAFFVDDINAATTYLQSKGVHLLSGPNKTERGPKAGQAMRYFLTPWGSSMELVYRPEPLPYERETSARLYGPAPSWRVTYSRH